jgi:hypothetical protein
MDGTSPKDPNAGNNQAAKISVPRDKMIFVWMKSGLRMRIAKLEAQLALREIESAA